ncbi:hypothetical protein Sar04_38290 [Salinispora arenicola]|uniref:Uncharacterized protein n=1 Tax=Salinispora arenicola TaxID=168697 RepID=A0ABQ4JVZ6_SALAC|nr:hypothetical protein Sar04_38290 [Salinispora arenicola]
MVSSGREVRADRVSDSTVSFIRSPLETTSAGGSWHPVSTSWRDTASRAGACATALVAGAMVADTGMAALMGALLVVLASPLHRGPVGYVFMSGQGCPGQADQWRGVGSASMDDTVRVPAPRHASRADREG